MLPVSNVPLAVVTDNYVRWCAGEPFVSVDA
jgi:hypothetical protein